MMFYDDNKNMFVEIYIGDLISDNTSTYLVIGTTENESEYFGNDLFACKLMDVATCKTSCRSLGFKSMITKVVRKKEVIYESHKGQGSKWWNR